MIALGERGEVLLGRAGRQRQLDLGVGGGEARDRARDEERVGAREAAQSQASGLEQAECGQLRLGGGHLAQDAARVVEQELARLREPDALGVALEQAGARFPLQRRYLP